MMQVQLCYILQQKVNNFSSCAPDWQDAGETCFFSCGYFLLLFRVILLSKEMEYILFTFLAKPFPSVRQN